MHLVKKSKMRLKYINHFIIYFLIISSLLVCNSNTAEEDKNINVGNKDAKIIVKVFSSLTCPYCADFHKKIFTKLKKEFMVFKLIFKEILEKMILFKFFMRFLLMKIVRS